MPKTRGLYHVSERRNFNFSPSRFSEIVAILTAPAVGARKKSIKNRGARERERKSAKFKAQKRARRAPPKSASAKRKKSACPALIKSTV
jgi:hypothetical protein